MSHEASTDAPVTGVEHWTRKGDVRLFLWEKFVISPEGKPAILCDGRIKVVNLASSCG